tara:strand:+ start:836 stop:1399 length:564 start_codon:yes stop_codon:yes gene_type:complete
MDEEIINKPKFSFNDFFKKNKFKILLFISFVIISIFLIIGFNEYKKRKNVDISEKYNKAKILIENKNNQKALKILDELVFKKNSFYSPSALNLIIDNNLVKDKKIIITYFDTVISKSKLDLETKNLFIFKKVIFIGDEIQENELLSILNPIIKSGSVWKNTMSDYIKKYYYSKGEFNKAKEFEILND